MEESRYQAVAACARFGHELEAFLEGDARPFIASHSSACGTCADLLADLQSIRQAAQDLAPHEPSQNLWARVRDGIEAEAASSADVRAQFERELQESWEAEVSPFISSHAEQCVPCGAMWADIQAIQLAARELPQEEPSPSLWTRLRSSIQEEASLPASVCARFERELEESWGAEINPFVSSHAEQCAPCGALLADIESIRHTASDLPQVEPSALMWTNLRVQLEADGAFRTPVCSRFEAELEAYLEGETRPLVVSHALACTPCRGLLADFECIRQAARDLSQEEPPRAVWANVRAQLEAEGAFRAPASGWRQILEWRLFPQAVPLVVLTLLVFLGSAVTLPFDSGQHWGGTKEEASLPAVSEIASALPAGEDGSLARVVSDLEKNYRANEASMAPDLKATYEKSLVSLDGSIRECLDSLRHEPGNTLAHEYLLTAYTRKAEVLSSALEFDGR